MGDPKKIRKTYDTPNHPWNKARIDTEKQLRKDYRFKNKKELWKTTSKLTKIKDMVKAFATREGPQVEVERKQIKDRLVSLGLLNEEDPLSKTLSITEDDIMGRRLQTIVHKRKLARSVKHARQLIVHKHIRVGDKVVTSPSMLVTLSEEGRISYAPGSAYMSGDHPERYIEKDLEQLAKKREAEKQAQKDEEEDLLLVPEDEESSKPGEKVKVKDKKVEEDKEIEIPDEPTEEAEEEAKEE